MVHRILLPFDGSHHAEAILTKREASELFLEVDSPWGGIDRN